MKFRYPALVFGVVLNLLLLACVPQPTNQNSNSNANANVSANQHPPPIPLNPEQFKPNPADPSRELMADISGLPGLTPQDNQRGVDLKGYKLEMSLQGNANRMAQLFFKDCRHLNSYRYDSPVGPNLTYDPAQDPKAVDQSPDFSHICSVGVKVFQNLQGIRVVSARLVK